MEVTTINDETTIRRKISNYETKGMILTVQWPSGNKQSIRVHGYDNGKLIGCDMQWDNLATAEEQIKRNAEIDFKLLWLEAKNAENKHDYAIAKYIAEFYGRKGIQALLIDNAIPQLQTISDELLQIATGGKMSIEFSTTKENKDGSQRESLEIICTDEDGVMDIGKKSGGQQKVLRNNIRLTLAIFQAQQSKKKIETLILDEPLDNMDDEAKASTLAMLQSLDRYFKKVILISHSDGLLESFPHRLELKRRNGVTVIC